MKKQLHFLFLLVSKYLNVFGCDKSGDSIALVSEILNIKPFDAIVFLNNNLGLGLDLNNKQRNNFNFINTYEQKKKAREMYDLWKRQKFSDGCEYLHLLENKYKEACKKLDFIEKVDDFFNNEEINIIMNVTKSSTI